MQMLTRAKISSKNFFKALTLKERYDFFQQIASKASIRHQPNTIKQWENRKSSINKKQREKIIEARDISDQLYLSNALSNQFELYTDYSKKYLEEKEWYRQLEKIFDDEDMLNQDYANDDQYGYLLRPFLNNGDRLLGELFNEYSFILHDSATVGISETLMRKMLSIAIKTFVYEIKEYKRENNLVGDTPEERLNSYFRDCGSGEKIISFYNMYPVLARKLLNCTNNYVKFIKQFLIDYCRSEPEIRSSFQLNKESSISHLYIDAGDSHQDNKSVICIEYDNGKKIMYKPKNLLLWKPYSAFIELFNQSNSFLNMKIPVSIIENNYTFEEFIKYESCDNYLEVENYYQRYGQLIAIMYLLNGNDLHMENIIAHGSYPTVIDIETLLYNQILRTDTRKNADMICKNEMADFVSHSFLLPSSVVLDIKGNKVDYSALSGEGKKLKKEVYTLTNLDTDDVGYEKKQVIVDDSNNIVKMKQKKIEYKEFSSLIVKGFEKTLSFAIENRDEVEFCLKGFSNCRVRILARNTSNYGQLLNYTYHPKCMKDALEIDAIIENIYAFPFINKEIINSEYDDLLNDDIPIFFAQASGRDVYDSKMKKITGVFEESGLIKALVKLKKLSKYDLNQQTEIIKVQLGISQKALVNAEKDFNKVDRFEGEIRTFGDKLIEHAVIDEKSRTASWMIIQKDEEKGVPETIKSNYYDGLLGVATFFHRLFMDTNEHKYKKIRDYCFNSAKSPYTQKPSFSSLTGYFATLNFSIEVLRQDPNCGKSYKDTLYKSIDSIKESISKEWTDISLRTGAVSLLITLNNVYLYIKDNNILTCMNLLANKIIRLDQEFQSGQNESFLNGYSGRAMAFLQIYDITKNIKYRNYAEKCLAKEKQLLLQKINDNEIEVNFKNGLIGLAYTRLAFSGSDIFIDLDFQKDLDFVLKEVNNQSGLLQSDSIDLGNSGVIDFYIEMYIHSGDEEYLKRARDLQKKINLRKEINGLYSVDTHNGFPSISLSDGELGIAFVLLRLHSQNFGCSHFPFWGGGKK